MALEDKLDLIDLAWLLPDSRLPVANTVPEVGTWAQRAEPLLQLTPSQPGGALGLTAAPDSP